MSGGRFTLDMLPPKARAQALAQLNKGQPAPIQEDPKIPRALQPMKGQKKSGPNKTEMRFYSYLKSFFPTAELDHEPITLRLANRARYTPDFVVWDAVGKITAYEVKGFMRKESAVRIKVAAAKFKNKIRFIIVYADKHSPTGWRMEEVLP